MPHCWHRTDEAAGPPPASWLDVCCRCGGRRRARVLGCHRQGSHGAYAPEGSRPVPVAYGCLDGCDERRCPGRGEP